MLKKFEIFEFSSDNSYFERIRTVRMVRMVRSLADRTFQLCAALRALGHRRQRARPEQRVDAGRVPRRERVQRAEARFRLIEVLLVRGVRRDRIELRLSWLARTKTVAPRVERFDRRGTEPFEPFEPFEFFQNRNFP